MQSVLLSTDQQPQGLQGYPLIISTGMCFAGDGAGSWDFNSLKTLLTMSHFPNIHTLTLNKATVQKNPTDCYVKCAYFSKFLHTQVLFSAPNQPIRAPRTWNVIYCFYTHTLLSNYLRLFCAEKSAFIHCLNLQGSTS